MGAASTAGGSDRNCYMFQNTSKQKHYFNVSFALSQLLLEQKHTV